jgi:alanine dehydrogenase
MRSTLEVQSMRVGVPKEIKRDEYRVAMLPVGVEELTRRGHTVLVEAGAGLGSGLPDTAYVRHGAQTVDSAEALFADADLIVKVKEPQPVEIGRLRRGQTVFTYFHFAADRRLTEAVLATGATAVAYETLTDDRGRLPLLTPMSEVAGRMSIQEGAKYLERPQMGRGILLGGVPGVAPASITILGGGIVGANAARIAAGFQANVSVLDVNMDRLRYLDDVMPPNVDVLFSDRHTIREQLRRADLVVGAVLIPGARTPNLVEEEDLKLMQPGAVLIDVAVDQGGCFDDQSAHDAQRADLRRARRRALLRDEHAGRRRPDEHLCPVQRHLAVGAASGGAGDRRRCDGVAATGARGQHVRWRNHQPCRGRDVRDGLLESLRDVWLSGAGASQAGQCCATESRHCRTRCYPGAFSRSPRPVRLSTRPSRGCTRSSGL